MTELAKMLAGRPYVPSDPELVAMRKRARRLTRAFNATTEDELDDRQDLLHTLFGALGPGAFVEPPFRCDYGSHILAGANLYVNFGCVVLDCNLVHIGDDVAIGPNVQLLAATHPVDPIARASGPELAYPIRIGDKVWLGGGVIVCPGVTIGDGSTIGAGSVVTRDVPAGVVAAGNPCRVLRTVV